MSKYKTWCLTSIETLRLIWDGEKGEGGMEEGEEGDYIYLPLHCQHIMIPALRWAAMRAILMFQ